MAFKLSAPIEKEFVLDKTDEIYGEKGDEPTRVSIRQATQADHERRSSLWDTLTQEVEGEDFSNPDSVRIIQRLSVAELNRLEVYLTIVGCNIVKEDGKELFKFKNGKLDMSERAFINAWGLLPPIVANEIHEKVREVNITWAKGGEES